jgi:hypothetical protein
MGKFSAAGRKLRSKAAASIAIAYSFVVRSRKKDVERSS